MCGIIAIAGNRAGSVKDETLIGMLACLTRRGPDDRGFEKFSDAVVGQTRLSIVDLAGGHQPMKDNENPVTIVFNGEIYGYKNIRKDLEGRGHRFSTESDTEVILKAYAEYGEKCINHLDGMFALAIWDENKKELFVARDRFGKKPFYYSSVDGAFYGASEVKSLFAAGIRGKVDPAALDDFLRLMYVPPYKTIYSNIQTLPPAHAGIVKNGEIKTWRYWKLEKKETKETYEEAKREIRRLLDESVRKRMVADVEIGSLLSGGVDSTIVTAYAAKYSNKSIKTFSVGYEHINELPYAETASKKIGTDHYNLITPSADLKELKEVLEYFDEPHADSSDFPQHLVSKLASSKVKVALSGDGADELLMGYGWYQKYWHTPLPRRIFTDPYSTYKKTTEVFSERERKSLMRSPVAADLYFEKDILSRSSNPFEKINISDLTIYLPGQLLTKVDRTSMMHSLEVRCPFLDTALAEYIYNLPLEFKISKTENKMILKDILEDIMPKEFVRRKKQGFGAPIKEWLAGDDVKAEISRILSDDSHILFKYLNKHAVMKAFEEAETHPSSVQKAWSLICLALWLELHQKFHE